MVDVLVCIAVASLLIGRGQAALVLRSNVGTACDVQYVVLHASIGSSCLNQCSLLLVSTSPPHLESLQGNRGVDVVSASTLLSTNVLTLQQKTDRHTMQISCPTDSDCRATPKSWQIENTNSGVVAAAQGMDQHHDDINIPQQASCVQEVNSTVSIAVTGEAADMLPTTAPHQLGMNAMFTWSVRGAVIASVVLLHLSSR